MPKPLQLSGCRFDRLTVKFKAPKDGSGHVYWECVCDCGNITQVAAGHLRSGKIRSCGCLHKEIVIDLNTKHGMARLPEYTVWSIMKQRCYNVKDPQYHHYGGRGITVCDEWLDSFEAFYRDMGPRPGPEYSIDRRENDKGYSKENCRWTTAVVQANNRRNTLRYKFDGEWKTLAEWCVELQLDYSSVYRHLKKGMTFEDAVDKVSKGEN